MSFLEPCLLLMLQRGEAHGYALLDALAEFGFEPELLDPSLIYRALREMEAAELVSSNWSAQSLGPQRRVYRISQKGKRSLEEWAAELQQTRAEIDRLLHAYESVKKHYAEGGDAA
ncbi:MAG: helix-turn-helix transcriptional regulator [Gemmatimonadota bacterium]|nr:MAG: helix-turn-helix transcriptional regulator [Gemmatimonadota bacterium]